MPGIDLAMCLKAASRSLNTFAYGLVTLFCDITPLSSLKPHDVGNAEEIAQW